MRKKMTFLLTLFLFYTQIQASDNVSVSNDGCLKPANIQITDITTYSIHFEWEDANPIGTSSLFQYTITEDENPLGGPTTTQNEGSSLGYMLLSPSTTYNLYLRTLCMGTWSDWSAAISFTTAGCDAVDMPYIQNFETLTPFFNLVECTWWDVISGNYWTVNQSSITGFDGNTLSYPTHQTQDANSWYIIQNGINIENGDKVRVSFKYASDGNGTEKLRLFMATNIDDLADGNGMQIADLTFSGNTVTEYVAGPIPFTATNVYYFGFQSISDANQGAIYIDDFRVEEWICGVPDEIEINDISVDGASISWIPSGNNTTHFYQYVVSTSPSEPEEGSSNIVSTGTNINNQVQNLDPNTVYYVYVRASCSGVWSAWSEPLSFTTLCDTSIPLPVGNTEQTLSEGQTLDDLDVDGENLTWYSDEGLTTEIEDETVAVNGTTYYVTQTIGDCTSEALAITVEVTLSVSGLDNTSFKVYPNPVKDFLNISYDKVIDNVEVINIIGQTVISKNVNVNHTQIDLSELPSGNYFVKINANGAAKTVKIVK